MKSRGRVFFRSFLILMVICQVFSLTASARYDVVEARDPQSLSSASWVYQFDKLFGTSGYPYPPDQQNAYLNRPAGMYYVGKGLFVTELMGKRLSLYNTDDGSWGLPPVGTPGVQDMFINPLAVTVKSNLLWLADWIDVQIFSMDDTRQVLLNYKVPPSGTEMFHCVSDLAFDGYNRLFVAQSCDPQNVLILDITGTMPNFEFTLLGKVEGFGFNNISQIAFGTFGSGPETLFVAERGGSRVQACTESGGTWTCNEFAGSDRLSSPNGITFWNGNLFIADAGHQRILRCAEDKSCVDFIANTGGQYPLVEPFDIVFDDDGNAYVSDIRASVIRKFAQAEPLPKTTDTIFAGTEYFPYVTDMQHFNTPVGVYVGGDGSLFITENDGHRVIKVDAAGNPVWSFGVAGQPGNDTSHLASPVGKVTVDPSGNVYIADMAGQRVVILKPDGTYLTEFSNHSNPGQFDGPVDVAFGPGGQLFVLDSGRNLVQVFTKSALGFQNQSTIGTPWVGIPAETDGVFVIPTGMAVASDTLVYIADTNHQRIQKCTRESLTASSWTCANFAGVVNQNGNDNTHLNNPNSVTVDGRGNVFVADGGNNRVQIYDQAGNYLATFGGTVGSEPNQFKYISSVSLDSVGNLYVADRFNYRIQKFLTTDPINKIFLPLLRK